MTEEKSSTRRVDNLGRTHIKCIFHPHAQDMFGRCVDEEELHEVCGNDLLQFLNCGNSLIISYVQPGVSQ